MNAPSTLTQRIRSGDRRAIARAITAVEEGGEAARALREALAPYLGQARVVGVTGVPGAGKSALVGALARELVERGQRVAVVAVDPSSSVSGGAVLGDRIRMEGVQADERVFIRSLASRGHLGGLARGADEMVDVLDAAGFDTVIVETVGAGQSEMEITRLAGTCIVVCPPGLGDDVQALKAGILEIADLFVVNKCDLPEAARVERELASMLALRGPGGRKPPVLKTVAIRGEGVAALADFVAQRPPRGQPAVEAVAPAAAERLARFMARDAYGRHLGIELAEAGEGRSVVRMRVRPEHLNFLGSCHGGAIFSLADMALGLACNSYGTLAALIDAHLTLSVGVKQGDWLSARATEISRTRKLAVYRSDVTREDGALIGSLTGTVYLTGKPLPQAGA